MNKLSLFIIGMPRSGTKLFRELLNNHGEIFIPEVETLFIPSLIRKFGDNKLSSDDVDQVIKELKESLFFFYYSKHYDFDFLSLNTENLNIKEFIDLLFTQLAKQRNVDASILGDKSPNYIEDIEFLQKNYPNAKFIHIIRDPRDYVISMEKAWGKNMYRAAYRWNKSIKYLNENKSDNIFEIKYEDLIDSPEQVLKNVCTFLSVPFDYDMINLDKSVENLGQAKSAGIKKDNYNKYLRELKENQISEIEALVLDGLEKYDYATYSSELQSIEVGKTRLFYWKAYDGFKLLKFNLKEHGIKKGLEKLFKASKHS